jgi:hypothetical protein
MSLPTRGVVARQAFLASVNAKPIEKPVPVETGPAAGARRPQEVATTPEIDPLVLRFLVVASQPHLRTLTEIYDELGVSRAKGSQVEEAAENASLSRTHRIPTGRKGGALALPEVLARGKAVLAQHGLGGRPVQLAQGNFVHEVCARALQACGKKLGYTVTYEISLGVVRLDARWAGSDGRLVFFQIGSRNSALYEAKAILNALKVPCVADNDNKLVFVACDRKHEQDVVTELKRLDPSGPWAKAVETRLVGEVVLEAMGK